MFGRVLNIYIYIYISKLFCRSSNRYTQEYLIHTKLIMAFTLNLQVTPYSEVIHVSANIHANQSLTKAKEK